MGEKLIGNVVRDLPYWTMQATPSTRAVNAMIAGSNPASPTMVNWRLSTKLLIVSGMMLVSSLAVVVTPVYDSLSLVVQGFVLAVDCLGMLLALGAVLVRTSENFAAIDRREERATGYLNRSDVSKYDGPSFFNK